MAFCFGLLDRDRVGLGMSPLARHDAAGSPATITSNITLTFKNITSYLPFTHHTCPEKVTATAVEHLWDIFSITAHHITSKCPAGSSLKLSFAEKPNKKPLGCWGARAGKPINNTTHFVVLQFFHLLCIAPSNLGT